MNAPGEVVAVVPTYRPTGDVLINVIPLIDQCDRVIVVDDGSGPDSDDVLTALEAMDVEVVRLPENAGIARALNVGVERALGFPATGFVLTVDQDSKISTDFVLHALRSATRRADADRVGMVVPETVAGRRIAMADDCEADPLPLEPIQSGMLIARRAFEVVGLFREEFVIDCVDSDFFLRVRRAGLLVLVCADCRIEHELGEFRPSVPGREGFSYHSPTRRYYMTRNRLTLLRENGRSDPSWLRRILMSELMGFATIVVFGSNRWRQVRAVRAGAMAYRRSEFGPIPDRVRARLEAR